MQKIIRVGVGNNFNHSEKEFSALEKFSKKGLIFLNSNGFTNIDSRYPSFTTLNPYLDKPLKLKGNLENVKALRVKIWLNSNNVLSDESKKALNFASNNYSSIPILITLMRFKSKISFCKWSNSSLYQYSKNWYRINDQGKMVIQNEVKSLNLKNKIHYCDLSGKGCPSCNNCSILSYGIKKADIQGLNLSISGIKDRAGNQGLCPFKCPDCWSKFVTFGKRPQCNKVIKNKKQKGKIQNN